MSEFVWVALPYLAFTFLVFGSAVRYTVSERTWTTKSSEFLEKKQLRIAGPLFHFALLLVFLGHVGGILVPQEVTEMFGIDEHLYHMGGAIHRWGSGDFIGGRLLTPYETPFYIGVHESQYIVNGRVALLVLGSYHF
mgnify:FL=1